MQKFREKNFNLLLMVVAILSFKLNVLVLAKSLWTIVHNDPPNCDLVKAFMSQRNITLLDQTGYSKGDICNGNCCDQRTEQQIKFEIQKDFITLIQHHTNSLSDLLDIISLNFQDHVIDLTVKAENKTLVLINKIYHRMSVLANQPISTLYSNIRRYVKIHETDNDIALGKLDIKSSIHHFFRDIFPLVYHQAVHSTTKDFTDYYKTCIKKSFDDIEPFGDIPKDISHSMQRSLESVRLLLQAFQTGSEVLNSTVDTLVEDNYTQICADALVKLVSCPKCLGYNLPIKTCTGYCLNVFRGCLTRHITELDNPWKSYVEAIDRMISAIKYENNEAGISIDIVIQKLNIKISEAIMFAIEDVVHLKTEVEQRCGRAEHVEDDSLQFTTSQTNDDNKSYPTKIGKRVQDDESQNEFPDGELLDLLTILMRKVDFFATLDDNMCGDNRFIETKEQDCWNGQEIGLYTKIIVDGRFTMQKYNPEMKITESDSDNNKITLLADRLRHLHHIIMAQINVDNFVNSEKYMQGDIDEGSGSGEVPDVEAEGSGSGENDSERGITKTTDNESTITIISTKSPPIKDFAIRLSSSPLILIVNSALVILISRFSNY